MSNETIKSLEAKIKGKKYAIAGASDNHAKSKYQKELNVLELQLKAAKMKQSIK